MRNRLNWSGGFLIWMLFGFMMLMFGLNPANGWLGLIAVASFFAVVCHVIALMTMFSFVKPTRESLQIVNPWAQVLVPWGRIRSVAATDGLVVSVLGYGDVACYAFQGSLLGKLAGGRRSTRVAALIEARRKEHATRTSGEEVRSGLPWQRHLAWFAVVWSALAGVIPILARLSQGW
ncbi:hypothetical protein [Micromonospora sp. WMMD736]|uniref:hypothetical protein n=1 Tax=Micromonospora sp. WMMD736 TaxID=3404112 RepID=UPI003B94283A